MSPAGFPHSEILGSKSGYRLPEAYRRFPRPSSVPGAKASTVRPCKLETKLSHKDARVHCTVLNTRPGQPQANAPATHTTQQQLDDAGTDSTQGPGTPEGQNHPPPRTRRHARTRWARSLRTQQRVSTTPDPTQADPSTPTPKGAGRTRPPGQDTGNGDGILMFHPSTRRGTNAHATGTRHRPPTPNRDGHQVPRCSLERR